MSKEDPVRGTWNVSGERARLWVDASALAIGAALEVVGSIVEGAAWLRPDDACHINMAKVDVAIKSLNVVLSWNMKTVELMTDSSTDPPENEGRERDADTETHRHGPLTAVYLYNVTPRDDRTTQSAPSSEIHRYDVRLRGIDEPRKEEQPKDGPYAVGDKVWVKPPGARCDTRYRPGTVTGTLSRQAAVVNGTPRHVPDLRRRPHSEEAGNEELQTDDQDDDLIIYFPGEDQAGSDPATESTTGEPRRSARIRRPRLLQSCDQYDQGEGGNAGQ
ncbi:hypothetical protein D918_07519 [Trichuris suis]|nr:hypothetical protein D918_07519 [Trichuris suis]